MRPPFFLTFCYRYRSRISTRNLPQRQNSGQDNDSDPLPTSGATVVKLNSDVLLEIFDFYRRIINYEKFWNDKDGWFKLAHVCREWRALVFACPSRLRLWLRFSGHRTRQAIASTGIPPLPIVVDYSRGIASQKTHDCMVSALADANHVCSIAVGMHKTCMKTFLMAINSHFPALESLELDYSSTLDFDFPPIFRTYPPPLRRLWFYGVACPFLYKLLSLSTTLVDITLILDSVVIRELEIPLIFYLQDLPSLCYLTVRLYSTTCPPHTSLAPPDQMGDIVLSQLRHLSFKGHVPQLEFLVARLAAPSLQWFHITPEPDHRSFPTSHLSRFIRNMGRDLAARLNLTEWRVRISILTQSHHSTDDSPLGVIVDAPLFQIGTTFSTALATVQDILITSPFGININFGIRHQGNAAIWRTFFGFFRNAKVLRISGPEREVGELLTQCDGVSSDFLPALEKIELNARAGTPPSISEDQILSVLDTFRPFVDARERAGRPVKVSWNTDRALPGILFFATRTREWVIIIFVLLLGLL